LRTGVHGQPHIANLDCRQRIVESNDLADCVAMQANQRIVESNDLAALRLALIGLHRHAIEMREASPMGGLLPDEERREALGHNE